MMNNFQNNSINQLPGLLTQLSNYMFKINEIILEMNNIINFHLNVSNNNLVNQMNNFINFNQNLNPIYKQEKKIISMYYLLIN